LVKQSRIDCRSPTRPPSALRAGDSYLALAEIATESGKWIAVQFSKYDLRAYLPRTDVDLRA
jgi:hypothetical protein